MSNFIPTYPNLESLGHHEEKPEQNISQHQSLNAYFREGPYTSGRAQRAIQIASTSFHGILGQRLGISNIFSFSETPCFSNTASYSCIPDYSFFQAENRNLVTYPTGFSEIFDTFEQTYSSSDNIAYGLTFENS
ncbi:2336_t:CDS:2 [Ambispora leptoticha]|uniref:2336_t:CDS:1 n=1 Tax=Ambispora leptoticha TaxID=144679 RepID=A0A9N9BAN2_9GLOM|nr:2336_t:CDS:2 [Ambispora leptoticha]